MNKETPLSSKAKWHYGLMVNKTKDVKEAVSRLNVELKDLLIKSNLVCGQALLNRKEEGYSVEHIFDNFFNRMKEGHAKIKKEIFGEFE